MLFLYFLLILFVVNTTAIIICISFDCPKGGWHEWYEWNWKTGFFKESGFNISYRYCVDYRCKKCGETKYWNKN